MPWIYFKFCESHGESIKCEDLIGEWLAYSQYHFYCFGRLDCAYDSGYRSQYSIPVARVGVLGRPGKQVPECGATGQDGHDVALEHVYRPVHKRNARPDAHIVNKEFRCLIVGTVYHYVAAGD